MALHLCPSCARHVRTNESSCPFCATALEASSDAPKNVAPLARGLTRAAILFAGATTIAGCGGETSGSSGASSSGASSSGSSGATSSSGASSSSSSGATSTVAVYGPAPIDAGIDDVDSGLQKKDSGVGPAPSYGPAPINDGGP